MQRAALAPSLVALSVLGTILHQMHIGGNFERAAAGTYGLVFTAFLTARNMRLRAAS
jgi:hypothetical protein